MSAAKPAPAPWRIDERYPGSYSIEPDVAWLGASSSHQPGENFANARLIAAAPEMLAALELAKQFGHENAMRAIDPDGWDAINAAISSAKGEA
jgi:hypothetical protein